MITLQKYSNIEELPKKYAPLNNYLIDCGSVKDTLLDTVNEGFYRFDGSAKYNPAGAGNAGCIITFAIAADQSSGVILNVRLLFTATGVWTSSYRRGLTWGSWNPL